MAAYVNTKGYAHLHIQSCLDGMPAGVIVTRLESEYLYGGFLPQPATVTVFVYDQGSALMCWGDTVLLLDWLTVLDDLTQPRCDCDTQR